MKKKELGELLPQVVEAKMAGRSLIWICNNLLGNSMSVEALRSRLREAGVDTTRQPIPRSTPQKKIDRRKGARTGKRWEYLNYFFVDELNLGAKANPQVTDTFRDFICQLIELKYPRDGYYFQTSVRYILRQYYLENAPVTQSERSSLNAARRRFVAAGNVLLGEVSLNHLIRKECTDGADTI